MPGAEDQPTRRVPPGRPRQPAPGAVGGGLPPEPHVRTWEEELADRIAALKNWVVLLAVLAVAALGVAIYAVVQASEDQSTSRSGVSQSQFDALQRKVSDLEDSSASDASIAQLKSDVSDLNDEVQKLQSSNSSGPTSQEFDALQQQVADLTQQIDDLSTQPTP